MNLRGFATAVVLTIIVTGFSTSPVPYIAHGQSLSGREYHVSPTGVATNDGSAARPLDLATALSSKSPARAGDIIWLHGGVYRGAFKSVIAGTSASPIIVRQFPGERATIDSSSSGGYDALSITGAYTWFWGFEIASSDTKRVSAESGSWPQDLRRGYGAVTIAPGTKFINMIVHDNANGLGLWTQSVDGEAYGNVIYNNGWQAPDRAHGHGVYTQNASGSRLVAENVIFNQFSHGIHAYGSDAAALDNITLDGNIAFMNGALGTGGMYANGRDILLGGYRVASNPVLSNNSTIGAQVNLGYSAGCANGRVTNNYIISGFALVACNPVMTGNVVFDPTWPKYGTMPTQYPQNTFHATQPTGTAVIRIRPNKYEPGRANIAIYNWGLSSAVSVDLAAARLPSGAAYQIRDAQNYYGTPVVDSVYDGRPVNIVMSGLRTAAPIGNVPIVPPHTAPKFAAFVVVPKSTSTGPTPPTAPGPTVTLSLSTSSVTPGQSATLSWSSANASSVSIDQGVGSVAVNGARTVAPAVTTTYTATATNSAGETSTSQVTLQVTTTPPPPPPGGGTGIAVQLTSPANNATALNQSTVTLSADVADPSNIVTKMEFYRGSTMIGTAWKKPFTMSWTNVSTGTYSITARAYAQSSVVGTSGAATLRVTAAPTVRLTSPAAGSYGMPATLTLSATATDGDGVARVEFYRGTTLIGTDTSSPYTFTWSGAPEGTHALTAKAFDNLGMAATSPAVSVTIGQPPSVQLISPSASGNYRNQGTITLEANATAPGSRITKVEFFRNGTLINSVAASPYRLNWTYVPTGTYTITAKAHNDKGLTTLSAPVTITVKP